MPGLISASAGSDWSYGGAILTFVFPMVLFLAVAAALYVLFTKPQVVPGHPDLAHGRSVSSTADAAAEVGQAAAAEAGQAAAAEAGQAASAETAEGE